MVILVLEIAGERYGVPARRVLEVIPAPVLRRLPGAPALTRGIFSYHGEIVPVIDLSSLLTGRPSRPLLSTRILIAKFQPSTMAKSFLLGFMAEHATDMIACRREDFQPAGVQGNGTPYAGDILACSDGLIQELDLDRVLSPELQQELFGALACI